MTGRRHPSSGALLLEFEGRRPVIGRDVFLAPTAVLVGDVEVADGSSVWFGAVLRADFGPIRIGPRCNIQDNVTIHVFGACPTVLDEGVTVGHGAALEGCRVGKGTVVGMNATVLPFATVGQQTVLAAGCVVPERGTIPDRVLAGGVPAQVKKALGGTALGWVTGAADEYVEMQGRYRRQAGLP